MNTQVNKKFRRTKPQGPASSVDRDGDHEDSHNNDRAATTVRSNDHDESRSIRPSQPQHSKPQSGPSRKHMKYRQATGQHDTPSLNPAESSAGHVSTGSHVSAGYGNRDNVQGDNDDHETEQVSSQGAGPKKRIFKKAPLGNEPVTSTETGYNARQQTTQEPHVVAGGDHGEQAGNPGVIPGANDDLTQRNRGMKRGYKTKYPSQEDGMERVDLHGLPDTVPPKTGLDNTEPPAAAPSDGFNDEEDKSLSRIQRRIAAIRKGGRKSRVQMSEDDPDFEIVDLNMVTTMGIEKKRRNGVMLTDDEAQKNIKLAVQIQAKWPQHLATGLTVAFVVADIALVVLGVTQEFHLVNIPTLELIEGVVELVKKGFETAEEAAEAKRNGRGESKEVQQKRKEAGLVALMELTGVERLNAQQKETYDNLRGLLALQQKEENAEEEQE